MKKKRKRGRKITKGMGTEINVKKGMKMVKGKEFKDMK
jgi:hypothetical protein